MCPASVSNNPLVPFSSTLEIRKALTKTPENLRGNTFLKTFKALYIGVQNLFKTTFRKWMINYLTLICFLPTFSIKVYLF